MNLQDQVTIAGWHTPDTVPDAPNKGTNCKNVIAGLGNQASGTIPSSSPAETESIVCGVADGISASVDDMRIACHANPLITEKVEGRVGLLKGYGNAIVPQVAAQFIRAYLESC